MLQDKQARADYSSSRTVNQRLRADAGEHATVGLNKRMGYYLRDSRKRLQLERHITAFFGVRTSWSRILDHAKYCLTAES